MAYASDSLALAALELFVHAIQDEEPDDLTAVQAEVPISVDSARRSGDRWLQKLPKDWRFHPAISRSVGDDWIVAKDSVALLVPSVVVDVEWNLLINPDHANFGSIKVVQNRPFRFDPRMFKPSARANV